MKYGAIERRRTRPDDKTDWTWSIIGPEHDNEDRVDSDEGPHNSLFWHYPEKYTKKEALDIMLEYTRNDYAEDILWSIHSFVLSKKSADELVKNNMKTPVEAIGREAGPPNFEAIKKELDKKFDEWSESLSPLREIEKKAWDAAVDVILNLKI